MCRKDTWTNVYPERRERVYRWSYCDDSRDGQPCHQPTVRDVGEIGMDNDDRLNRPTSGDDGPDRVVETRVVRRVEPTVTTSTRRSTQIRLPWQLMRPSTWNEPAEIVRRTVINESPSRGSRSSRGSRGSRGSDSTGRVSPKRVSWGSDNVVEIVSPSSESHRRPRSRERPLTSYERPAPPPLPSPPPFRRRDTDTESVEYITVAPERQPRTRSLTPPPRSSRTAEVVHERLLRRDSEEEASLERQRRVEAEAVARNAGRSALNEQARRFEAEEEIEDLAAQTAAATLANTRTEQENARLRNQLTRERSFAERERALNDRERRLTTSTETTRAIARTSPPRLDPSPRIVQRRDGPLERRGAEVLARERAAADGRRQREQAGADAEAQARRERRRREQIMYSDEDRRRWAGHWN